MSSQPDTNPPTSPAARAKGRKAQTRTGRWKPAFLEALEATGQVKAACRAAGVSRNTAYEHFAYDPVFHRRWERVLDGLRGPNRARNYTRRSPRREDGTRAAALRRRQGKPPRLRKHAEPTAPAAAAMPGVGAMSDRALAGIARRVLSRV